MSYPIVYQADRSGDRNRLTAFFRLLVAIPIALVTGLFGIAAFFAVFIAWFALLFTGKYPEGLYKFVRGYVQMNARTNAYTWLQTDDYPPFDSADHPEYPIRVLIPEEPAEQSRVSVLFRVFLLIPVFIVQYVLAIALEFMGFAAWLMILFTGKLPEGLQNGLTFVLGYLTRATAYATLLTDKWPPFSDDGAQSLPAPSSAGAMPPPPPPPPPPSSTVADAPGVAAAPSVAPPPPPPPPPSTDDDAPGPFGPSSSS